MKKRNFIFTLLLFLLSLSVLYGCANETAYAFPNAFVTIDINPSIEIITGEDGLVEEVNALNEDAEILLAGTDFSGKTVEEVSEAIMQLGIELGYVDSKLENAIIITAEAESPEKTEKLEERLVRRIQRFIRRKAIKLTILKAKQAANKELLQKAEELGVSVGKLKLAYFAVSVSEELTLEEAVQMSVRDLTAIVKAARKEFRPFKDEFKDLYFQIKEEIKIKLFLEKVKLINDYIQAAPDEFFEKFISEQASPEDIRSIYQKYWEEVSTFNLSSVEIPDELLQAREQLREQLKELLNKLGSLLNDKDRETFKNTKKQLQAIEDQIREAVQDDVAEGNFRFEYLDFVFENRMRYPNIRHLRKIRQKYVEAYKALGIDMDVLEEYVMEHIKEKVEEVVKALNEELKEKSDELKTQAQEHMEYLKKEKEMLREANKQNNTRQK